MSVPVVAFFNNKGGVGKTTLVYHVSWMYADQGRRVLVADLDPQANLTAAFLEEERLEELWSEASASLTTKTIYGAISPLLKGLGDVQDRPHIEPIAEGLHLLAGDLALAQFEDELSQQWPSCADGKERGFRVISAFWRLIQKAAEECDAEFVLLDLGPNLGALNRAALVASDYVIVPLVPDLFSLQGLKNLGPTVRTWRSQWADRRNKNPAHELELPRGDMRPAGYVVMQHAVRSKRPTQAYDKWIRRIPEVYATNVLQQDSTLVLEAKSDPNCLALMKHYRSLMAMSQEASKPIFHLRPADGAIGAHYAAVSDAREQFEALANRIDGATFGKPNTAG